MSDMSDIKAELLVLKKENADLRELVRDMYKDTRDGCSECRSWHHFEHRGNPSECDNGGCGYKLVADRMRELGVEVDA